MAAEGEFEPWLREIGAGGEIRTRRETSARGRRRNRGVGGGRRTTTRWIRRDAAREARERSPILK